MLPKLGLICQLLTGQLAQPGLGFRHKFAARKKSFSDNFCCSAGGGGADVGHKITDRIIDLMADGRDHWQFRMKNGASDDFFVESPQVFEAAASSAQQDEIETEARTGSTLTLIKCVQQANRRRDLPGSPC